ncbi:uncharacterized protein G2W53_033142 [Senna tora]|uniref:Uncharacterized protein n=1 Tax=Senna tora TaxID=362788 RepID=A0A834WAR7_9FABA|nr:uncharacterized protein G2W53_033142 [Senna tora]
MEDWKVLWLRRVEGGSVLRGGEVSVFTVCRGMGECGLVGLLWRCGYEGGGCGEEEEEASEREGTVLGREKEEGMLKKMKKEREGDLGLRKR